MLVLKIWWLFIIVVFSGESTLMLEPHQIAFSETNTKLSTGFKNLAEESGPLQPPTKELESSVDLDEGSGFSEFQESTGAAPNTFVTSKYIKKEENAILDKNLFEQEAFIPFTTETVRKTEKDDNVYSDLEQKEYLNPKNGTRRNSKITILHVEENGTFGADAEKSSLSIIPEKQDISDRYGVTPKHVSNQKEILKKNTEKVPTEIYSGEKGAEIVPVSSTTKPNEHSSKSQRTESPENESVAPSGIVKHIMLTKSPKTSGRTDLPRDNNPLIVSTDVPIKINYDESSSIDETTTSSVEESGKNTTNYNASQQYEKVKAVTDSPFAPAKEFEETLPPPATSTEDIYHSGITEISTKSSENIEHTTFLHPVSQNTEFSILPAETVMPTGEEFLSRSMFPVLFTVEHNEAVGAKTGAKIDKEQQKRLDSIVPTEEMQTSATSARTLEAAVNNETIDHMGVSSTEQLELLTPTEISVYEKDIPSELEELVAHYQDLQGPTEQQYDTQQTLSAEKILKIGNSTHANVDISVYDDEKNSEFEQYSTELVTDMNTPENVTGIEDPHYLIGLSATAERLANPTTENKTSTGIEELSTSSETIANLNENTEETGTTAALQEANTEGTLESSTNRNVYELDKITPESSEEEAEVKHDANEKETVYTNSPSTVGQSSTQKIQAENTDNIDSSTSEGATTKFAEIIGCFPDAPEYGDGTELRKYAEASGAVTDINEDVSSSNEDKTEFPEGTGRVTVPSKDVGGSAIFQRTNQNHTDSPERYTELSNVTDSIEHITMSSEDVRALLNEQDTKHGGSTDGVTEFMVELISSDEVSREFSKEEKTSTEIVEERSINSSEKGRHSKKTSTQKSIKVGTEIPKPQVGEDSAELKEVRLISSSSEAITTLLNPYSTNSREPPKEITTVRSTHSTNLKVPSIGSLGKVQNQVDVSQINEFSSADPQAINLATQTTETSSEIDAFSMSPHLYDRMGRKQNIEEVRTRTDLKNENDDDNSNTYGDMYITNKPEIDSDEDTTSTLTENDYSNKSFSVRNDVGKICFNISSTIKITVNDTCFSVPPDAATSGNSVNANETYVKINWKPKESAEIISNTIFLNFSFEGGFYFIESITLDITRDEETIAAKRGNLRLFRTKIGSHVNSSAEVTIHLENMIDVSFQGMYLCMATPAHLPEERHSAQNITLALDNRSWIIVASCVSLSAVFAIVGFYVHKKYKRPRNQFKPEL